MTSFVSDLKNATFSKFLIIFLTILNSVIVARVLGPERNGIIAALLVYPTIFITLGSLGIRQSITICVAAKNFDLESVKTAATHIWLVSTVLTTGASFLLIKYFSTSGNNIELIILAVIPVPFTLYNIYTSGIYLGKNDVSTFNKINWLPVLFSFAGTVFLVLVIPLGIQGVLIANIWGPISMFIIVLQRYGFSSSFKLRVNLRLVKSLLRLGIIYAVSLLIINLNFKIDIVLMDILSTPFETGIYMRGAGVIQYLWEFPMLLSAIIFARSANSIDGKAFSYKIIMLLRLVLVVMTTMSVIIFFSADLIIYLFFGKDFQSSVYPLRILIPGVLLLTIFNVLNMDLAGKAKPWISIKAMAPALLCNIFLNFIFIPLYGAKGAAFSSSISYSIGAITFIFAYSKEVKIEVRELFTFNKNDFIVVLGELRGLKQHLKLDTRGIINSK